MRHSVFAAAAPGSSAAVISVEGAIGGASRRSGTVSSDVSWGWASPEAMMSDQNWLGPAAGLAGGSTGDGEAVGKTEGEGWAPSAIHVAAVPD